ncbi:MAG: PQQ-binding-like beta-propeller repeat protein [Spirochaetales bacterium]|uniref:PQQ-binding-like beta-propeller repeat protein n=1 Tax=Candidatus Thalassospirochaeta sargassi TaxID=3119039 RepID=A0AAJ1ICF5_9SPIO|nr:PQQ-binding-like beta-propeller repeat protein [Spirochaetales bacterium]
MSRKFRISELIFVILIFISHPLVAENELVPLWKYAAGGVLVSPPAVSGTGVYLYSEDRQIHAVSTSGDPMWKFRMPGRPVDSLSVGRDGTVYASTLEGRLFAVNQAGRALWRYDADSEPAGAPAVSADGTVYVASKNGELAALSHTGFIRWKIKIDGSITGSPVIDAGEAVYISDDNGALYSFSPWGTRRWTIDPPAAGSDGHWTAAIDSHILYSAYGSTLRAIEGGEVLWSINLPARISGIVIFSGGLFCSLENGNAMAFERSGVQLWQAEGSHYDTYPVAGASRIFLLSRGGLISLTPEGQLEGAGIVEGIALTQPVMGGGLLVCGSEQWVACAFNVADDTGAGWSQKGGGPDHSGVSGRNRWYFNEEDYMKNMDYLYLKQYITAGSTDEKLEAIEEIGSRIAAEGIDRGEQYLLHLLHLALTEGNIRRTITADSRSNDYPAVRREAAKMIGLYGNFESIELLTAVLEEEKHYDVSAAIMRALGELGTDYDNLPLISIYNKVIKDNNGSAHSGLALAAMDAVADITEYSGVPGSFYGYRALMEIYKGHYSSGIKRKAGEVLRSIR